MSINSTNARNYSTSIDDLPCVCLDKAVLNVDPYLCVITCETVFIQPFHSAVFEEVEVLDNNLSCQL